MNTKNNDIRLQLKHALVNLEAARSKRHSGASDADTRSLEIRIKSLSAVFTRLMEKLIAQTSSEPSLGR